MDKKNQKNNIYFMKLDDDSLEQVVGGIGIETSEPGTIQIAPDDNPAPLEDKCKINEDLTGLDIPNLTTDLEKIKIIGTPGGKTRLC